MDLTSMPGELDVKDSKKVGSDMKREHDSVDDFEHLDPDSPGDGHGKEKFDIKNGSKSYNVSDDLIEKSHDDDFGLPPKPVGSLAGNISSNSNLLDFGMETKQIKTEDIDGKSNFLDFEVNPEKSAPELGERHIDERSITKHFISAEIATDNAKTEHEIPILDVKNEDITKEVKDTPLIDTNNESTVDNEEDLIADLDKSNSKSMKEDDALPQYETKLERRGSPQKEDYFTGIEKDVELPEPKPCVYPNSMKEDVSTHTQDHSITPEPKNGSHGDISEFMHTKDFVGSSEEFKETPPVVQEPAKSEPTPKPVPPVLKDNVTATAKKMSISDLDDIIGPEDVFKRIGLDAWFTPERLHPKVEALVYWRDPKKSGVVFGGGMVILLSLCFMSLISVIAYTSLFVLTGTICFRIYKNILQAVQKTSEGHPFKEFLELELSLPQDKVREVVDTAVVHVNASVVELRRLFLVEDLIDSIKFGVCLWCLTYVGAIFNGMTLVILAFVALFTVPKIYENNKASIDQYIEMGRSKVAEVTSKVKAAVPIGKKEPEKDKEQ